MAYLNPDEGWVSLRSYQGDMGMLAPMVDTALSMLHECLKARAVHGDLTADHILIR